MARENSDSGASGPADLQTVRRALKHLERKCRGLDWCRGYGIAPAPGGGDGFVLRVNVAPGTPPADVPDAVNGVPVLSVVIDRYTPRSRA